MIKCDFHLHTIPTKRDSYFDFTSERFKEYIEESKLNCIAITNHNIFDRNQFDILVNDNPNTSIYPGIEINVHTGHIIVIANPSVINDFEVKAMKYNYLNDDLESFANAKNILDDFSSEDYIIIPHYDKKDQLSKHELKKYGDSIFVGEVSNAAKFYRMKNDHSELLTPWLSSDYRVVEDKYINTNNCTFIDAATAKYKNIRDALKLRRVYLDYDKLDLITDNDLLFSYHPNLNVLIGGRSSGKTHLLTKIYDKNQIKNVKYVEQFSLLEPVNMSEEDKQKKFEKKLKSDFAYQVDSHKSTFSELVDSIIQIDLDEIDREFTSYCESIIKFAQDSFAHNTFAKHPIFSASKLEPKKTNHLEQLVKSASNILFDKVYSAIVDKYDFRLGLIEYLKDLCFQMSNLKKENDILLYTNDTITEIIKDFSKKANIVPIKEYSILSHFESVSKVQKFENICTHYVKEKAIFSRKIGNKFEAVATKRIPKSADDLRALNSNIQGIYKEGVTLLAEAKYYEFLQWCKKHEKIQNFDIHKLFIAIRFELLNEYKLPVSGGERAEYNLLKELSDAEESDLLLIDEPESSFDNIFLNKFFNEEIRRLSKKMPVIVATHNSTIGASLSPNFYIYTERLIVDREPIFNIFYGLAGSEYFKKSDKTTMKSYDLIMDRLEAGEDEYKKRGKYYEKFND